MKVDLIKKTISSPKFVVWLLKDILYVFPLYEFYRLEYC